MTHEEIIQLKVQNYVQKLNEIVKGLMVREGNLYSSESDFANAVSTIYRDFYDGIGKYFFIIMNQMIDRKSYPESIKESLLKSYPQFRNILSHLFVLQSEIESLAIKKVNASEVSILDYAVELEKVTTIYMDVALESFWPNVSKTWESLDADVYSSWKKNSKVRSNRNLN